MAVAIAAPADLAAQSRRTEELVVAQRVRLEGAMTRAQAERLAVEQAMAEAVRRVAGVRVSATESMTNADSGGVIASRYAASVRLDAEGHVVAWKLERGRWVSEKRRGAPPDLVYDATVRVAVALDDGVRDEGFRLTMDEGRSRLAVRGAALSGNDEVVVSLSSTRDAHLVIVVLTGDSVTRLLPNQVLREARLVAGARAEWPSADWRDRGLHFRVSLPPNVAARTEVIAAIALLDDVAWPNPAGGPVTLAAFNRWLVEVPVSRRAVAQRTVMVERAADETQKEMPVVD